MLRDITDDEYRLILRNRKEEQDRIRQYNNHTVYTTDKNFKSPTVRF